MDDTYRPTTEDIRTAWYGMTRNVVSFDRWLAEVKAQERVAERERCIEIMDLKSGHYARTHYAGKVCYTCDIFAAIYEGS